MESAPLTNRSTVHPENYMDSFYRSSGLGNVPNSHGCWEAYLKRSSVRSWGYSKNPWSRDSSVSRTSSGNSVAMVLIVSESPGSPLGNAAAIARRQILEAFGAPIVSRASATKAAVSELLLGKY